MFYFGQVNSVHIFTPPPVIYGHYPMPLANSTPRRLEFQQMDEEERELQAKKYELAALRVELDRQKEEISQKRQELAKQWEKIKAEREEIDKEREAMRRERTAINYKIHLKRIEYAQECDVLALERKKMAKEREEFVMEMARKRKAVDSVIPGSIQVFCANEQPVQKRMKFVKLEEDAIIQQSSNPVPIIVNKVNNYTINLNAPVKIRPAASKRKAAIKANKKLAMIAED